MDEVEKAVLAYVKLHNQGEAKKDEMIRTPIQAEVGEDEVVKHNNQREEQQSGEEPQSQRQPAGKEKRRPGRPKANKVMELVPYAPEEQPPRCRGGIKS